MIFIVYGAATFSLENKDSLLPDGRGEITDYQQNDGDNQQENESEQWQEDSQNSADIEKDNNSANDKTDDKVSNLEGNKDSGVTSSQTDKGPTKEEAKNMTAEELKIDNSEDPTASNGGNKVYKPDIPEPVTVTISINCNNLSSDMNKLENKAIEDYIPKDGWILKPVEYNGTTDNTVFDVLNTVCRNNKIQLDFKFTPLYESYYIQGINYLYEFDGGKLSGWMYKVNGWFPNYGCSSYYLRDGDVIEWVYTCDLGKDVGDNAMSG